MRGIWTGQGQNTHAWTQGETSRRGKGSVDMYDCPDNLICLRAAPDDAAVRSVLSRAARAFETNGRLLILEPPILRLHDLSE